jgi:hypothetical protein
LHFVLSSFGEDHATCERWELGACDDQVSRRDRRRVDQSTGHCINYKSTVGMISEPVGPFSAVCLDQSSGPSNAQHGIHFVLRLGSRYRIPSQRSILGAARRSTSLRLFLRSPREKRDLRLRNRRRRHSWTDRRFKVGRR